MRKFILSPHHRALPRIVIGQVSQFLLLSQSKNTFAVTGKRRRNRQRNVRRIQIHHIATSRV